MPKEQTTNAMSFIQTYPANINYNNLRANEQIIDRIIVRSTVCIRSKAYLSVYNILVYL
jgi:hypothetical protein